MRDHLDSLRLPVATLKKLRLNIEGVATAGGAVVFRASEDCADLARFARDKSFGRVLRRLWSDVLRHRRELKAGFGAAQRVEPSLPRLIKEAARKAGIPGSVLRAASKLEGEQLSQEWAARGGRAIGEMRKTALFKQDGRIFILSTQNPSGPLIVAQSTLAGAPQSFQITATGLYSVAEILWELFAGVLTVMGVSIKANIPMGRILDRLSDFIRRRPRLLEFLMNRIRNGQQLSAIDIIQFLLAFMQETSWECLGDVMLEVVDLTYWGIIRFLLKMSGRLTPGLGQTLLAADLALVVGELVAKIAEQLL